MPILLNRLRQLAQPGYQNPGDVGQDGNGTQSDVSDQFADSMQPGGAEQGPMQSPLSSLASADATGADSTVPLAGRPLMKSDFQSPLSGNYATPALDRYRQFLENPPQPPGPPSRMQRIAAAIASMGGGASPVGISGGQVVGFKFNPEAARQAGENVLMGPYERQMKVYDTRAGLLEKAAEVEQKDFANRRLVEQNLELERIRAFAAETQRMNALEKAKKDAADADAKNRKMQQDLEIANRKLEIAQAAGEAANVLRELTIASNAAAAEAKVAQAQAAATQKSLEDAQRLYEQGRMDTARIEDLQSQIKARDAKPPAGGPSEEKKTTEVPHTGAITGWLERHGIIGPISKKVETTEKKPLGPTAPAPSGTPGATSPAAAPPTKSIPPPAIPTAPVAPPKAPAKLKVPSTSTRTLVPPPPLSARIEGKTKWTLPNGTPVIWTKLPDGRKAWVESK